MVTMRARASRVRVHAMRSADTAPLGFSYSATIMCFSGLGCNLWRLGYTVHGMIYAYRHGYKLWSSCSDVTKHSALCTVCVATMQPVLRPLVLRAMG